jgi:hypothetical protein
MALAATLVAVAGTVTLAPPATARGDDEVISRGQCTLGGDWKLKAKPDDGRIEVEFEVDTNRVGQRWKVRMSDNRVRFFAGRRTTQAPSGSFSVERRTANRAGQDVIRARAVRGDNVCAGRVTL